MMQKSRKHVMAAGNLLFTLALAVRPPQSQLLGGVLWVACLAVWFSFAATSREALKRFPELHSTKILVGTVVVSVLVLGCGAWWLNYTRADKRVFAVKPIVIFKSVSRDTTVQFWVAYKSYLGNTLTPANMAIFLRVVNLQSRPTAIDTVMVEMKKGFWAWTKLIRLTTTGTTVYWGPAPSDIRILTANDFEIAAAQKVLQPFDTVQGWLIFEYPEGSLDVDGPLRITITSTEGEPWTINVPVEQANEAVNAELSPVGLDLGVKADLSSYQVKRWLSGPYISK